MNRLDFHERVFKQRPVSMKQLLLLALVGCATLGAETAFPEPLQTSGVGPFRLLDEFETGVSNLSQDGLVPSDQLATSGGMFAGDHVFYTLAAESDTPPEERDASLPSTAVDWRFFEPRRIYRSAARAEDLGHGEGVEVLAPQAGEDGVFDPWVVVLDDGRARMYFATSAGIAIAEAPSVDGTFARMDDTLVADARSPSVVQFEDQWLMAYESNGQVLLARSSDGLSFDAGTVIDLDFTPEEGPAEASYARPGAVVATVPSGRTFLRIYFEIIYEDGSQQLSIAASEDGSTFERFPGVVFGDMTAGAPAPRLFDDGSTVLYFTISKTRRCVDECRTLVAAVAPFFVRFAEEPEVEME